jgi:hypothetical protein
LPSIKFFLEERDDPVMDQLADEYRGWVVIARFMAVHFWLAPTNWEVFKRYSFSYRPTVILLVDGKGRGRWVWDLKTDAYRKVLDPLVSRRPAPPDSTAAARPQGSARPELRP